MHLLLTIYTLKPKGKANTWVQLTSATWSNEKFFGSGLDWSTTVFPDVTSKHGVRSTSVSRCLSGGLTRTYTRILSPSPLKNKTEYLDLGAGHRHVTKTHAIWDKEIKSNSKEIFYWEKDMESNIYCLENSQ